jgi:DNA-binding PadR family transcriptional regulator
VTRSHLEGRRLDIAGLWALGRAIRARSTPPVYHSGRNGTSLEDSVAIDRRDERVLLLLGLLTTQSQHGYQINEFIEHNLGRVSQMKKATAYALLTRMEAEGLVEAEAEREGKRPTRRVYAITPQGSALMREMMVSLLEQPLEEVPAGDIAVMYIASIEPEVAIQALQRRIAGIESQIAALEATPKHPNVIGVDLAIDRRLILLRADQDWFVKIVERIRRGEIARPGLVAAGQS